MNPFAFIDYKKPIGKRNDYRTSTYRAHVFLDDTAMSQSPYVKRDICRILKTKDAMPPDFLTVQQRSYTPKASDPDEIRNPTVSNIKNMIACDERLFLLPPKPLSAWRSVYNSDFQGEPEEKVDLDMNEETRPSVRPTKKVQIEPSEPGYSKHLDSSATTTKLSYQPYSTGQTKINEDTITYWSWVKYNPYKKISVRTRPQQLCDKVPAQQCPRRLHEYQKQLKPVPTKGLTTETRHNYKKPSEELVFTYRCAPETLIGSRIVRLDTDTENKIYGSGQRVNKYVDIGVK